MHWTRISFPRKIHRAEMLAAGLRKFMDRLKNVGVNEDSVNALETLTRKAMKLKQEQNHLRARHKVVTSELQAVMDELGKEVSYNKAMVKVELDRPLWVAFGIPDKK